MWAHSYKYRCTIPEVIATKLAELQHAPGVTPYLGRDYRVHYRRADGTRVPEWDEVAVLVRAGHHHDITPDNALQLLAALKQPPPLPGKRQGEGETHHEEDYEP